MRGQNVIITIRTTIPWGDEVQIVRPVLTGSMVWWAHPYARPWGRLNQDGTISRLVEVRAAVRVDAPGFYSIDPFHIMTKDHEAVTEIVRFIGVGVDERDLPYPVFTQWRSPPKTLWQGQTVPLVLEARNLPFLALVDSVMLNQEPGGLLEDAPGFGRINTRPYGEDILYDMPMASWLWTLNEPGSFVFPGVRVMVHGLARETRGFSVDVKPLPPQAQRYGAVGRFLLDVEWEDKQYRVGEVVSIRVRVEGEGNMSVLRTPTPRFPGAEMVSSDSSSFYLPGPLGYKGWREERFNYRIDTAGELKITIPKWTWFYPEDSGLLYDVEEQIHTIFAKEASGEAIFNAADMLLGAELFRYRTAVFHGRNFRWYLLALPGLLILAILYLRRRSKLRLLSAALILPPVSGCGKRRIHRR